jgi:predicted phosphate transport protein (TIGR00153 family)
LNLPGVTFSRKEGAIVKRIEEDLAIVRKVEQQIPALVGAVAAGDGQSSYRIRDAIYLAESEADAVHRELSTLVAEGAFFGGVREDILELLERIDDIADRAKGAAELITLTQVGDQKARAVLESDDMKQFLANLDLAVEALQRLIEAFEVDRKTILQRIDVVEKYEEAADEFKHNMLKTLFDTTDGRIDPLTLLLVRDFLFCADDVADSAEDASDVVLVLVAKGYG